MCIFSCSEKATTLHSLEKKPTRILYDYLRLFMCVRACVCVGCVSFGNHTCNVCSSFSYLMPFEVFIAPDVQIDSNTDAKRDDDKHCGYWVCICTISTEHVLCLFCVWLLNLCSHLKPSKARHLFSITKSQQVISSNVCKCPMLKLKPHRYKLTISAVCNCAMLNSTVILICARNHCYPMVSKSQTSI